MITPEELAEVARLDREATSGPWEASPGADYVAWIKHNEPNRGRFKIACVQSFDRIQENAAFVARARTLLPRLAAAHEELLAKHGALFDAASKLTIAVRSGRGVTEALATLELVLDPEGEEVAGG